MKRPIFFLLFMVAAISEATLPDFSDHPCRRSCNSSSESLVCKFIFRISMKTTMGRKCRNCPVILDDCFNHGCMLGSGSQRAVMVANDMLPGPSVEVCKGDTVVVEVMNMLMGGETVTIHWHGILQSHTPFMDGVSMITQCPILPRQSFTYRFEATEAGTYWWHTHAGTPRGDGLTGALIIRDQQDPNESLFDRDDLQPIVMQDWLPSETFADRFAKFFYGDADFQPNRILVNGVAASDSMSTELGEFPVNVPAPQYSLNSNMKYRFRLINTATFDVPMKVEFDCHYLVVIASDGHSIVPKITKSLTIFISERYDFVPFFNCNESVNENATYRLMVRGLGDAAEFPEAFSWIDVAYTDDDGKGKNPNITSDSKIFSNETIYEEINFWDWAKYESKQDKDKALKSSQLEALDAASCESEPDFRYLIEFDFIKYNDRNEYENSTQTELDMLDSRFPGMYIARLNKIQNLLPPVPLLSQWEDIPGSMFCNAKHRVCNDTSKLCQCLHAIPIPLGANVELVLVDTGDEPSETDPEMNQTTTKIHHPMHLHGYHFKVVAQDRNPKGATPQEIFEMVGNGSIALNTLKSPTKDTIGVPIHGFTVLRFKADNAGPWLFHCHIQPHAALGMSLVFLVGEPQDVPPVPNKFPICRSFN